MAGLDSILPDEAPNASASPTPTTGLGGYTTITGAKGAKTVLDPTNSEAVLKKMQDYLDSRTGPQAEWMNRLADARAAAIPNLEGKSSEAMNQRQTTKTAEAKDVQDMQMQIANFRAQQALQAQSREDFGKLIAQGGQGGQGGLDGQGGQGGQGSMGAIDPLIMARILSMAQTDPVAARALYDKTISENNQANQRHQGDMELAKYNTANAPAGNEQKIYMKNGKPVMLTTNQWNALSKDQRAEFDPTPATPVAPNAVAPNADNVTNNDVTNNDVAKVESNHNPNAIGPYVPGQGRAKGEMQVMDRTSTDQGYGVKPAQLTGDKIHDQAELARVGRDYHAALITYYGDATLGTAAYNWGPGKMDNWLASGADISKMPADVRDYVGKAHMAHALSNRQPTTTQAQPAIPPVQPATTQAQVQTPP